MRAEPIYLEDLTQGATYTSSEHRIDAEQILAFAEQFDPQPFHAVEYALPDQTSAVLVAGPMTV
ncbi:hypothetical protein [Paraburkholderia unamae]|uniref:hypothetical protein n=1 Tax=Paraburkholderia unamae TaxID=219649 RepID=UPI003CCC62B7